MATDKKRSLIGRVVSDKMDKTVVVSVSRTKLHPIYGKIVRINKKFKAHDQNNEAQMGDTVRIIESRPISKEKRWLMTDILEKTRQ